MENKELVNKDQMSIFTKIVNYFKNIFYKPKKENIIEMKNDKDAVKLNVEEDNDFLKSLKVQEVMDYFSILALQNKLETGEINEEDLTDEEYEAVAQKYIDEIEELKEKIYKRKIQLGMVS